MIHFYSKHWKDTQPLVKTNITFISMAASFLILAGVVYGFKQYIQGNAEPEIIAMNTAEEKDISDLDQAAGLNIETAESYESSAMPKNEANALLSTDQIAFDQVSLSPPKSQVVKTKRKSAESPTHADDIPTQSPSPKTSIAIAVNEDRNIQETKEESEAYNSKAVTVVMTDTNVPEEVNQESEPKTTMPNRANVSEGVLRTGASTIADNHGVSDESAENADGTQRRIQSAKTNFQKTSSTSSDHSRKSFPKGGMDAFEQYLKANPLSEFCKEELLKFKFQILKDGTLDDVQVLGFDEENDVIIRGRCIIEAKELLIEYGRWETDPPNRKIRRTYIYDPMKFKN